jgi:hypothetical protein
MQLGHPSPRCSKASNNRVMYHSRVDRAQHCQEACRRLSGTPQTFETPLPCRYYLAKSHRAGGTGTPSQTQLTVSRGLKSLSVLVPENTDVSTVITGASSVNQIQENLTAAADKEKRSDELMVRIDKVLN